jgi:hypothetical protein
MQRHRPKGRSVMTCFRRIAFASVSALALAACQHELAGGAGPVLTSASAKGESPSPAQIYSASVRQFGTPAEAKMAPGGGHFVARWTDAAKKTHSVRLWHVEGTDARLGGEWQLGSGWSDEQFTAFSLAGHAAVSPTGSHVALISFVPPKTSGQSALESAWKLLHNPEPDRYVPPPQPGLRLDIAEIATGKIRSRDLSAQFKGCGAGFLGMGESLIVCEARVGNVPYNDIGNTFLTRFDGANADAPSIARRGWAAERIRMLNVSAGGNRLEYTYRRQKPGDHELTGEIYAGFIGVGQFPVPGGNDQQLRLNANSRPADGSVTFATYLSSGKGWIVTQAVTARDGRRSPRSILGVTNEQNLWFTSPTSKARGWTSVTQRWRSNADGSLAIGTFGRDIARASVPTSHYLVDAAVRQGAIGTFVLDAEFLPSGREAVFVMSDRLIRLSLDEVDTRTARQFGAALDQIRAGFSQAGGDTIAKLIDGRPHFLAERRQPDIRHLAVEISNGTLKMAPKDYGRVLVPTITALMADESRTADAVEALILYGLMAYHARQPGIMLQVEAQLRKLTGLAAGGLLARIQAGANLIGGMVPGMNQGSANRVYDDILAKGGLNPSEDDVVRDLVIDLNGMLQPLFAERTKLAFLLGMKEDELPRVYVSSARPIPSVYPDLAGNLIQPAGLAAQSTGPLPFAVAPSVPAEAPRPAAISGGGQVLD